MLWLISWFVTSVLLLCIPFFSKHGRTISKKNIIILLIISAVIGILLDTLFYRWYWVSSILITVPIIILLFKDFRIVYNVSEKDILKKIKTMLERLFCKYQIDKETVIIDKVGKIKIFPMSVVTLLIISSSNSPKSQIIFGNIFKIFYDNEY